MPYLELESKAGQKRKRPATAAQKASKARRSPSSDGESIEDQVFELEAQISESRKHYNNIVKLLALAKEGDHITETSILPAVALCRVFCRLFAGEIISRKRVVTVESEVVIVKWLRARLDEYVQLLCDSLKNGSEQLQSTALTLAMRLVKEEVDQDGYTQWEEGIFARVIQELLLAGGNSEMIREEFCEKFFSEYDDIWFFTLSYIAKSLKSETDAEVRQVLVASSLEILSGIDEPPKADEEITLYAENTAKDLHKQLSAKKQKKQVQAAWMAILKLPLTKQQNKDILSMLIDNIIPWFSKVELLMDYLTDSFNLGGATSLLSLSGLFHLMQERNLDYPAFYQKLYSLLDDELLHSKHRSRFFRLLDVFMGSTHLPAALVASFIKRLSRLALHAPPAGIVVAVPWIYNMFKQHPQCTFMIHRLPISPAQSSAWTEEGFNDPFSVTQSDPMITRAIDSSLWEIQTLQSHWHPNVATLAKIISEQFAKQNYNMEDFLDHSYNSLLEAELGRDSKKTPVVEWEIPKTVFLGEDGQGRNEFGVLMEKLMQRATA